MARRKVSFDVEVNTPSATREAERVAKIFEGKLSKIAVGTSPGKGGAGGGTGGSGSGGGGLASGMPGSSVSNLLFGSAQFAFAGFFYKFFSELPGNIAQLDTLATTNKRTAASFVTVAGGASKANAMIDAYVKGSGNVASRTEATVEAMRLFDIGMVKNAKQVQAFTTLSRGMSQTLGKPVEYVQEQFSLALANQSQLRFDQLGLSIQRHKEIMDDLRKQYPDMTREVAFQNAMLQQATEKYYNLATAQEALASGAEVLARQLKNSRDAAAGWFGVNISNPAMSMVAGMFGAKDYNLMSAPMQAQRNSYQAMNDNLRKQGGPSPWDNVATGLWGQSTANEAQNNYDNELASREQQIQAMDAVIRANNAFAAAENAGVKITEEYDQKIRALNSAIASGVGPMDQYEGQANVLRRLMEYAIDDQGDLASALDRTATASEAAAAAVEQLAGRLEGAGVNLVGKLMGAGFSAQQTRDLIPGQDDIDAYSKQLIQQHKMEGDIISDEIAAQEAQQALFGKAEDAYTAAQDAARDQKSAASDLERAAKKQQDMINSTADKLKSTFDDMLHAIPGVFGTSEVTDEDLKLASKGIPTNFPDDPLRRLEDVAYNKKKRDDVNLDDWAQALQLPKGTDPEVLAIYARRAWQSGELFSNPENIEKFMNVGAVKGGLIGQEQAALGTQNLEAFFGLGTDQGNQFLKVFGVKAMDPIQDGLISEITTRGPIMGKTLADAMYTGFDSQAMSLPWVAKLMEIITSQTGVSVASDMNTNASSDLAESESVGYSLSDRLR